MAYNYPKIVQNGDGTFGPTNVQHFYKPIVYHCRGAVKKDEKSRDRKSTRLNSSH